MWTPTKLKGSPLFQDLWKKAISNASILPLGRPVIAVPRHILCIRRSHPLPRAIRGTRPKHSRCPWRGVHSCINSGKEGGKKKEKERVPRKGERWRRGTRRNCPESKAEGEENGRQQRLR